MNISHSVADLEECWFVCCIFIFLVQT